MSNQDEANELASLMERYTAAAHAVQSGIGFRADKKLLEPKHMRVGIDLSKSDMGGLAKLLIAKGVFTELEYIRAMVEAAELEKANLEKELSKERGITITLA